MIRTSLPRTIATAAASAAVAAALTVAVAPAAHADDQWGACAAGGRNPVCVVNETSEAAAVSRANALCNYLKPNAPACPVVASFTACGALAHSGNQFAVGTGTTQEAAEQAALNQLTGSTITTSTCNG